MEQLTNQQIVDEVEDALSGKLDRRTRELVLDAVWNALNDNRADPEES